MADLFGLNQDQYLTDDQRVLAADTSRAFMSADAALQRTLSRYSLPQAANAASNLALSRAQTFANATNRMRMDVDARTRYGGYPSGRGQGGSTAMSQAAGIARLAPLLLGQDKYNQIIRGGVIPWVRDIFGNPVAPDADSVTLGPAIQQGVDPEVARFLRQGQAPDNVYQSPEPTVFPEPAFQEFNLGEWYP